MASAPSATLTIAKYKSSVEKIAENDSEEIMGWLTKNSTDNMPWILRVKSEFYRSIMDAFPNYLEFLSNSRTHGAVNGIALVSSSHNIYTVENRWRPEILYRVIHGGQPNKGIKSRLGRGSDPIFLQLHFQKHLRWRCRERSPFLSATDCWEKALQIAAVYALRGFADVEIINFKTTGPGWNHNIQRLWSVRSLIRQLDLKKSDRSYFNNEYLVEHSIPEESIIGRSNWEQDKSKLDPRGIFMRKARDEMNANKRRKQRADEKRNSAKAATKKRNAGDLDESEPETKKRKTGKWVNVGIKVGRNVGA
ncbi:hypothetical protein ColLi_05826 [Colletotrichum liriopes]|uniref:DUF7587 domain-containing protein n=1 Tax=Colletotrichum liriopes TaxID=708192 RepID=A0AA37GMN5_9PEZI|nr:hypothetical protein ColLi_05826 [Colletotrichum liriopes]